MNIKNRLLTFLRFLLLITVCILATVVLVYPLWKFATAASKAYTVTVLLIAALLIIFLITRKIITKSKRK